MTGRQSHGRAAFAARRDGHLHLVKAVARDDGLRRCGRRQPQAVAHAQEQVVGDLDVARAIAQPKAEIANRLENRLLMRFPGRDDHASHRQAFHLLAAQQT